MENTLELLSKLAEKPKVELEYTIEKLMLDGKIDFISIVQSYTKTLETFKKEEEEQRHEALSCACDLLFCVGYNANKETKHNAIHRALYSMNESKQFNMHSMNEKFNYNEDEDKHLSYYYRKHHEY